MTERPPIDSPRALAGRRVVVMGLGLHGGAVGRTDRPRDGRRHGEPPRCAPGAEPRGDPLVVRVAG